MKKLIVFLFLAIALPALHTGCQTAPSARVTEVQTLGVVGSSAKSAMDTATQLLKSGQITVPQWQAIANFYDNRWQPTYNLAVSAVQSNLSTIASPDLSGLLQQFLSLVAQLSTKP